MLLLLRGWTHDFSFVDAQAFSPEPMKEETETYEDEQEAGSFSPELLHGDENEEAIDPEEDRVTLVSLLWQCSHYSIMSLRLKISSKIKKCMLECLSNNLLFKCMRVNILFEATKDMLR